MKRRQVERQMLINQAFPSCKQSNKDYTQNFQKNSDLSEFEKSMNFNSQIGAQKQTTPYRSYNRVNNLLKGSPVMAQYGHAKLIETSPSILEKVALLNYDVDLSKPSSITTAMTKATSTFEGSIYKNQKKRDYKKKGKKELTEGALCQLGKKRASQLKIDQMEYFTRINAKSAGKLIQTIKLRDKKSGMILEYPLVEQRNLKGFRNSEIIKSFDMTKLEVEYDYDTDVEQQKHSKKMLLHELSQAIEFYVNDEPLKLVDNIMLDQIVLN